jgi:hypothetical protein
MNRPVYPDFVFAGAARSGSTAVVESLRRRDEVFVTQPKEPHYLALAESGAAFTGPGDDLTINAKAVTDRAAYDALFIDARPGTLTGEGSVSTLYYSAQAAPRLKALNPDVRVVVVLREPVARAYSSHQYLVNRGFEPVPDFLEAVDLEEERISAGWHHLWHYTSMSRYAEDVARLLEHFPATGVWWYDDLMRDEESTLAEIHEFVGLSRPEAQLSVGRVNASGAPRRPWMQTAMQVASRSGALRRAVKAVVPFDARERLRRSNLAVNDVPPDVRRSLAPRFADDLDRLEAVLGRPVPAEWRS